MKKLSPAMEDYLKGIYRVGGAGKNVHVSELALYMGVSKPCVSRAMDNLSEKGLICKNKYQGAYLTEEGVKQARLLSARCLVIRRFFSEILHVDPHVAEKDACSIEHSISTESYESMRTYLHE
ncbi:MAG: metal-dependent transcriptional regulator [Clostridiales Family XIII bacterium]|jgi:DtxR family Mn-dependent transcriptional regulator|nr:metal-dependent transcriptional regulator [Clostridiales Family XIII bacterium]